MELLQEVMKANQNFMEVASAQQISPRDAQAELSALGNPFWV